MLRLGRRGIVLSLFINGLNITLYLIILVAACLNIVDASINFIILNAFAASFACLLVISEIRLPQLTYEYFRFLCTYRGRGMTYLFFGCLVASRTPFNLYGGIIVVCMGLAFFMLSYVKLIPPLDGLILNIKKLDQWKEQKHFRVQLEAQRIFEQQLQQEQNLTRLIPAHHSNSMTAHVGSPKQLRAFSATNTGSTNFSSPGAGAGVGVGVGSGTDTSTRAGGVGTNVFSPPSLSQRPSYQPVFPSQASQQQQNRADQGTAQLPPSGLQKKQQGSTSSIGSEQRPQRQPHDGQFQHQGPRNTSDTFNGRSMDRKECAVQETRLPATQQPLQLNKTLPPIINTAELEGFPCPSFALSPPRTRRGSAADSEPGSPLQYLIVDDPLESAQGANHGNKAEWDRGGESILKSAPHHGDKASRPLQQQQFPLRTTNKPAPPHDPFRRASLSSKATASKGSSSMASNGNTNIRTARGPYQSLYQPPEPPGQPNSIHPLQSYRDPTTRPTATTMTPTPGEEGRGGYPMPPLTATGHILSSIGGMSGCYGIVGGIPGAAPYHRDFKGSHCAPNSMHHNYPSHQHHLPQGAPENASRSQHTIPSTKGGAQSSGSPMLLDRQQHSQQQPTTSSTKTQGRIKYHMPDIILTLPTPAETANASRREGYFAM